MPLIKLEMSGECTQQVKDELCLELSRICAEGIGKPEAYVASLVVCGVAAAFGGELADSAFVEVRSIGGLGKEVNTRLSKMICHCVEEKTGIPGGRVYVNFTDVPASAWGHDGSTFG